MLDDVISDILRSLKNHFVMELFWNFVTKGLGMDPAFSKRLA